MSEREWDVALFGATGFTGGLVADYLAEVATKKPLRWALAGRSQGKLEAVLARLPRAASAPELVLADASDAQSLVSLAQRTRVLITTVGPYGRYGEPLLRACAEQATDYVDLTGEPEFVDVMRERYHALAQRNRTKIINACGFDSIPHDLGAYFALQRLRARLPASERDHAAFTIEGFVRSRGKISGGTLRSTLDVLSNAPARARQQRRAAAAASGERKASQLPRQIGYRRDVGFWAVSMPSIDPEVVVRSAQLLPEYGPDFRYGHYLAFRRLGQVAATVGVMGTVFGLAQLPPAKALLEKLMKSGDGPDAKTRANSSFRVLFVARGAGQEVRCEVRGGDPGYGETSKMLAEAALCLAFDRERLPEHYGVVPSAAAFGNPLIERLKAAGIAFAEL